MGQDFHLFKQPNNSARVEMPLLQPISAAHIMLPYLCGTDPANLNSSTRPTLHSCYDQSQVFNWVETHHPVAQVEDRSNPHLFVIAASSFLKANPNTSSRI